jgi:hypothetical protein
MPSKAPKKKARKKPKYAKVNVRRFLVADLLPAPYNARTISQQALQGLASSLEQFGLLALPVVNVNRKGKPRIVSGHQRVDLLRDQREKYVQCIVVELDAATEKQANFALNNEAIQGEFVPAMTKELLDEIRRQTVKRDDGSDPFASLRFDTLLKRINRQIPAPDAAPKKRSGTRGATPDEDAMPPLPAKSKSASVLGAMYVLGDHLLLCGPPKQRGTLKGFGVDQAQMSFTEVVGSSPTSGYLHTNIGQLLDNTEGAVYVATTPDLLPEVQHGFISAGGHWSTTLVWHDPNMTPDADQPYTEAVIPVVYGWRPKAKRVFFGRKSEGNVFTLTRSPAPPHTPVEVAAQAMRLSSEANGWVLDTNAGHGGTLIAAEKTGRKLLGYARNVRECDRARKRWAEFVHGKGAKWKALTPKRS